MRKIEIREIEDLTLLRLRRARLDVVVAEMAARMVKELGVRGHDLLEGELHVSIEWVIR